MRFDTLCVRCVARLWPQLDAGLDATDCTGDCSIQSWLLVLNFQRFLGKDTGVVET
jgi:hypothetical protein